MNEQNDTTPAPARRPAPFLALSWALTAAFAAGCHDPGRKVPDALLPALRGDPRLAGSSHVARAVDGRHKEVDRLIGAVNESYRKAHAVQKENYRVQAKGMAGFAAATLQEVHNLDETLRSLHRELTHARAAYLAAADAWQARSEDYKDDGLRRTALGYGDEFKALAAAAPGQAERAESFRQEVVKLLPTLRESRQGIDDFALFLDSYPGTEDNAQVKRYLEAIQDYVRQFEQFEGIVRRYRGGRYVTEGTPQ